MNKQENDQDLQENYDTVSETISALVKHGYTQDFNIKGECLVCHQTNTVLSPEDFRIDKVYRFEGASNPEDESVVYAISSPKFGAKGILVNGYGISAEDIPANLVHKLSINQWDNTKSSQAAAETAHQPEKPIGESPLSEYPLPELMSRMKDDPAWNGSSHQARTLHKSENLRIVLMGMHPDAELKPHRAPGDISVQVLEGEITFITEQKEAYLRKGQMITLPADITHSVKAHVESFFLLTMGMK